MLDTVKLKRDFPILSRKIGGKELVYLDNAATTQKPKTVVNAITDYYFNHNANVHRGVHTLGDESTQLYASARKRVADFIHAREPAEIVFTSNTTQALNMVAFGWGMHNLKANDVILTSASEHNSNLLPWRLVAKNTGAIIKLVKLDPNGVLNLKDLEQKLVEEATHVKVIVLAHASNVLGTIFPIKKICALAKKHNVIVVVDGAQAIPHLPVNVQSLGCDFYAFSGHKMLGPMGIGVLWAKKNLLDCIAPVQLGGGTVLDVDASSYDLAEIPERFEAGTPNVADAVGLAAALDYLDTIGMENIRAHEIELSTYALKQLLQIRGIIIIGPPDAESRTGLISFVVDKVHAHDIASILNSEGVAVRSGMHCAMQLHKDLGIPASVRASYYLYNSLEDIDKLVAGIKKAVRLLS